LKTMGEEKRRGKKEVASSHSNLPMCRKRMENTELASFGRIM